MNNNNVAVPKAPVLPERIDCGGLNLVRPFYHAWFARIAEWMVERYERREDYPFLDTKYDVIHGRDFREDDPYRGLDAVYGWIQGRGLESLVFHARWLTEITGADRSTGLDAPVVALAQTLGPRLTATIRQLYRKLTDIRSQNDGHIYFLMDRNGVPRFRNDVSPPTDHVSFADIFVAKGLFAAASYLKDGEGLTDAVRILREIESCLWTDRFTNGQFKLQAVAGATKDVSGSETVRQQGPFMILLGALALVAENSREFWCVESGLRIVEHILLNHVALSDGESKFSQYDMWETIGSDGAPYLSDGCVVSDPGHSIEFAGLGGKFLRRVCENQSVDDNQMIRIRQAQQHLSGVLFRNFENGYLPESGGIIKQFDLLSRLPVDDNLPWWSLPESMRSAMEIAHIDTQAEDRCAAIFAQCHNALSAGYLVSADLPLWVQTRSGSGAVVDVIPACSDVDPGYHTNMSIIEALELVDRMS